MSDISIKLDDTFVTRELEKWELDILENSNIEDIGITIYPVNAKTNDDLGFQIPFNYKNLKKNGSIYEGKLDLDQRRYILKISGEMKVKLRSGVVSFLNDEDGGYFLKLDSVKYEPKEGPIVQMQLAEKDNFGENKAETASCYTVKEFTIV